MKISLMTGIFYAHDNIKDQANYEQAQVALQCKITNWGWKCQLTAATVSSCGLSPQNTGINVSWKNCTQLFHLNLVLLKPYILVHYWNTGTITWLEFSVHIVSCARKKGKNAKPAISDMNWHVNHSQRQTFQNKTPLFVSIGLNFFFAS